MHTLITKEEPFEVKSKSMLGGSKHTVFDCAAYNSLLLLAVSSGLSGGGLDVGPASSHPQLERKVVP